jgi:site-specific recombinase XerD
MATFDRSVSRVAGSLARYAAGFAAELAARGYSEASIYLHLRLVADLSVWLSGQGLCVKQLSPAVADRFVHAMRATGRPLISARGLAPVTGYLHGLVVLPEHDLAAASERDALLWAYQRYLRTERGVCERTVHAYTPFAVAFLAAVGDPLDAALAHLSGPNVLDILSGQLNRLRRQRRGAASTKLVAQADRSLLRFLHAEGHTSRELASIVPRMARWRLAGLPTRLDAATIAVLLASCDRATETGRRDYAVLLILVRLGLRSCEVTRLTLDDLNWRVGEITIHGKGDRVEAFPLPWDVGEALVDYLRVRRASNSTTRTVFLTVLPPYRELTIHGLGSIVLRSCRRAGVAECGPHVLRHSLASALLAAGASLADIGEVLRHVDPRTTAIYAKVDRTALAVLVRPWPARPEHRP